MQFQTKTPTVAATANPLGFPVAWATPSGALGSGDPAKASAGGGFTHELRLTNFGFIIPGGATIRGITVTVDRKASEASGDFDVRDHTVSLIVPVPSAPDINTQWPTAFTPVAHGGIGSGLAVTPDAINDANFGVLLIANLNAPEGQPGSAFVRGVSVTVHYE